MSYCPDCGGYIPDGVKYCRHCGNRMRRETPAAGYHVYQAAGMPSCDQQPVPAVRGVYSAGDTGAVVRATGGSITLGVLIISAGLLMITSTFIYWVPMTGFSQDISILNGWELMMRGSGNFAYCDEIGFTGFWPLLIGLLLILFGALAITHRYVGLLPVMLGTLGITFSSVSIMAVYERTEGEVAGPGLWIFGACSLLAFALGVIRVNYKGRRGRRPELPGR